LIWLFLLEKYSAFWLKITLIILILFKNKYILPSFILGYVYAQH